MKEVWTPSGEHLVLDVRVALEDLTVDEYNHLMAGLCSMAEARERGSYTSRQWSVPAHTLQVKTFEVIEDEDPKSPQLQLPGVV